MMRAFQSKQQHSINALRSMGIEQILFDEPLRAHCSWRIGGPADILVEPSTADQLSCLLHWIAENGIAYLVIGGGSNLLFSDEGFRGIVIKIGRAMSGCVITNGQVQAQAGIAVPRLARRVGLAGLTGMEHAVGIPGTLGGLVAMNGGSQRQGIGQAVKQVCCVDESGQIINLQGPECDFSYRHSIFLGKRWIITDVVLEFRNNNRTEIQRRMLEVLRDRRCKFPRRLPNCGSVFKSDPALYEQYGPPGKIIEELGLKGFSIGDAQVSTQHANFIINREQAKASDVLKLIQVIRNKAHEKTGVWLECEVRYVSEHGNVRPAHALKG